MLKEGTGLNIRVTITSDRGLPMQALDFRLDFYCHPNRREKFRKEQLAEVRLQGEVSYYAQLDTKHVGAGRLMCDVLISSPESQWENGVRPIVVQCELGILWGACGCKGKSVTVNSCQGYTISFEIVNEIPKSEAASMFYGRISNQISSFSELTASMIASPDNAMTKAMADILPRTPIGVSEGDKIVVLLPYGSEFAATKDNGLGVKIPFDTTILGSNGEQTIVVNGEVYKVYGELVLTAGVMHIYID